MLLADAGRRPERLGPARVLRLGELYRAAAADLATARRRYPRDPAIARLEALVGRARHLVYDARGRRVSFWRFVTRDYWRLVAEQPRLLLLAAVLLGGASALGAVMPLVLPS